MSIVLVVSGVCCRSLDGLVQYSFFGLVKYSSLRVVSSSNASSKRVAEVKEVSAGLQESQDCKKNCPGRQQRVLHVSG